MVTLSSSPQTAWLNQELAEVRGEPTEIILTKKPEVLQPVYFNFFMLSQLPSPTSFFFSLFKWLILVFVSAKTALKHNSKLHFYRIF